MPPVTRWNESSHANHHLELTPLGRAALGKKGVGPDALHDAGFSWDESRHARGAGGRWTHGPTIPLDAPACRPAADSADGRTLARVAAAAVGHRPGEGLIDLGDPDALRIATDPIGDLGMPHTAAAVRAVLDDFEAAGGGVAGELVMRPGHLDGAAADRLNALLAAAHRELAGYGVAVGTGHSQSLLRGSGRGFTEIACAATGERLHTHPAGVPGGDGRGHRHQEDAAGTPDRPDLLRLSPAALAAAVLDSAVNLRDGGGREVSLGARQLLRGLQSVPLNPESADAAFKKPTAAALQAVNWAGWQRAHLGGEMVPGQSEGPDGRGVTVFGGRVAAGDNTVGDYRVTRDAAGHETVRINGTNMTDAQRANLLGVLCAGAGRRGSTSLEIDVHAVGQTGHTRGLLGTLAAEGAATVTPRGQAVGLPPLALGYTILAPERAAAMLLGQAVADEGLRYNQVAGGGERQARLPGQTLALLDITETARVGTAADVSYRLPVQGKFVNNRWAVKNPHEPRPRAARLTQAPGSNTADLTLAKLPRAINPGVGAHMPTPARVLAAVVARSLQEAAARGLDGVRVTGQTTGAAPRAVLKALLDAKVARRDGKDVVIDNPAAAFVTAAEFLATQ